MNSVSLPLTLALSLGRMGEQGMPGRAGQPGRALASAEFAAREQLSPAVKPFALP